MVGYDLIYSYPGCFPISLLCGFSRDVPQSGGGFVQLQQILRRHIPTLFGWSQRSDRYDRSRCDSARVKDQFGELPKIRNSSKADGPLPGERSSNDPRRGLAHAAASNPKRLRSNATRCAVLNHAGLPCRVAAGVRKTDPSRPRRYLPPADENYLRDGGPIAIWRAVERRRH